MPGVVVPLAFVSADADHAAILCANTGGLRERRCAVRSTGSFTSVEDGDPVAERMTEKRTPRPERERGVPLAARGPESAHVGPAYWPK
ncbi:hypothetical protein [Burkholderia stabilis]|uniref:hypothetical protein n=1 Tax=Burkholderia stabilis TaxID=95485 RepID=UPI00101345AD|nr:hypothetical protein [Burkholderia stabilis]